MASFQLENVNTSRITSPQMNSSNNTDTTNIELSTELLTVIQITCYSAIIVIGTIGNLMLIINLALERSRKTSQYFILNLAVVDLLTCTLSIPFDITLLVLGGSWPFGRVMCRLVYPLQTVFMAVSVSTLLCMALERHRAILYPLKPKITGTVIKLVIFLVWAISVGLVSLYAAALKMKDSKCVENWPGNDPRYPKAFTLCVFLILYLSPLCVITAAYARVGVRLRANSLKAELLVGTNRDKNRLSKSRTRRNIRIVKFFVLAVVAFAVCLLPFQVMWMWSDFGNGQKWKHFNTFLTFANVMVYANSAVNPYIFGALGRRCSSCKCLDRPRKPRTRRFKRGTFPFYGVGTKTKKNSLVNQTLVSPAGSTSNRSTSPVEKGNRHKEKKLNIRLESAV